MSVNTFLRFLLGGSKPQRRAQPIVLEELEQRQLLSAPPAGALPPQPLPVTAPATVATVTPAAVVSPAQVFQATTGIYDLPDPNVKVPAAVLTNPNVDGIALRSSWSVLQPSAGVFNWSYLDSQIALAAQYGKKVSLNIKAGTFTPDWVYAAGAARFSFVDESSPQAQSVPVPWDPVFLAKWQAFIQTLGAHYASNPALAHVKITGINIDTGETMLPRNNQVRTITRKGITWTTTNDVANWQSLGYTRTRVEAAYQTIADAFSQAFPTKQIAGIFVAPYGFPPIDAAGNIIPKVGYDPQATSDLIQAGIRRYGQQYLAMSASLSAASATPQIAAVANQITTGYQMTSSFSGANAAALQTAVNNGIAAGAKFLEIYQVDVTNIALQNVIASAHATLNATIPTATITGGPATDHVPLGTLVSLGSSVADPIAVDPSGLTYAWSVTYNGSAFASGSGSTFGFLPDDSGTYVVSLTVTDSKGRTSPVTTLTIIVDSPAMASTAPLR